MKHLILIIALMVPAFSFAQSKSDALSSELLETLMLNSSHIELAGDTTQGQTIAGLLSSAFATETMISDGESVVINSVSSRCDRKEVTATTSTWSCSLVILDGDYIQTKSGYKGPMLESAVILSFETTTEGAEKPGKHTFKGKTVVVQIAG